MKSQSTVITLISLFWFTSIHADDTSLLSPEKQTYFQHQQHQIDATYEKLRYDWLSPINLNASSIYEKSASFWAKHTRKNLSAGIAQDLFRSGGIT
ncbi:MAG: TolC family protein, partial [Sulfuricurvum sp.]|nr:TolC family protein [Sulfuricurvum sp.]